MKFAELEFTEDGTPQSSQFGDVYFSKGHGQEETQYVFIDQNHLPERFSNLAPTDQFTIAETGFGTGLNFLVAWRNFLEHAPEESRLTFISCEKYPLTPDDLKKAHLQWPVFSEFTDQIQQQYPPALNGYHLLEFGRVNLLLMFGDAAKTFSELSAQVDAWFLDGFAPAKNPDMWQPELFSQIKRLSHPKTTAATFTAARIVRDGLIGAGFQLEKVKGYGKKRHMIRGNYRGICGPERSLSWPSSELVNPTQNNGKRVAVIGAGIAGVTTALELTKRGFDVEIFDQNDQPAQGGSGNIQGAVYAKLSSQETPSNRFYAQALIKAQQALSDLPDEVPHSQCGLVQLVHNERELKRLKELTDSGFIPVSLAEEKTSEQITNLCGIEVKEPGLWFSDGGWVSPQKWVKYLVNKFDVTTHFNTKVQSLELIDNRWLLKTGSNKSHEFDQVVVAAAFLSKTFEQTNHLPLNPLAGQVTQLATQNHHNDLKAVICTDRYVMPPQNELLTIGATFRVKSTDDEVTQSDHEENLSNLQVRLPSFISDDETVVDGRAAVRCNSPDYLPLVGAISEPSDFANQFRIPLQKNRTQQEPPAKHHPGLWVNAAHGSKGLCSSHLCAKLLASMMSGEPYPVQSSVLNALNPNRFEVRTLRRSQRTKS